MIEKKSLNYHFEMVAKLAEPNGKCKLFKLEISVVENILRVMNWRNTYGY